MEYLDINVEENIKYLEIIVESGKTNKSLEILLCKFLECVMEKKEIKLQKNTFSNNSILLTFTSFGERILVEKGRYFEILSLTDNFNEGDFYLTCSEDYLSFLDLVFPELRNKVVNVSNKMFYCKNGYKHSDYLKKFIEKFDYQIIKSKEYRDEIIYSTKLKSIEIPKIDFLKEVDTFIYEILNNKGTSEFFILDDNFSDILHQIENSNLIKYDYFNSSVKSIYIMIKSLIDVNIKFNLPTCSQKKILDNINSRNYIETVNFEKSVQIKKGKKIDDFNYEKFIDVNEAISYNIHLSINGINGFLFPYMNFYFVCYEGKKIEKSDKEYRSIVIGELKKKYGDEYEYQKYSLFDLVNVFDHCGVLIFNDHKTKLNPENMKPLPIEYFENKNLNFHNLTGDVSGVLKGITEKKIFFDRSDIDIKKRIDIDLIEKIPSVYSIVLTYEDQIIVKNNIYIDDYQNLWLTYLMKIWRKGYYLTDYGLQRYRETGEIKLKNLKFPQWLSSNNSDDSYWLFLLLKSL